MSFPVCKFFRSEQGCKFGNKCRYKHSETPPFPGIEHSDHYQSRNDGSVNRRFYSKESHSYSQEHFSSTSNHEAAVRNPRFQSSENVPVQPRFNKAEDHNEDQLRDGPSASGSNLEETFQGLDTADQDVSEQLGVAPLSGGEQQQRTQRKVCHFFARNGYCSFGSGCRFDHAQPNPATAPRFQQGSRGRGGLGVGPRFHHGQSQPSDDQSGRDERLRSNQYPSEGRSYVEAGPCKSGSAATNNSRRGQAQGQRKVGQPQHAGGREGRIEGEERKPVASPGARTDKICQFYVRGWCVRGRRCRFLHPRRGAEPAREAQSSKTQPENQEEKPLSSQPSAENDGSVPSQAASAGKNSGEQSSEQSTEKKSTTTPTPKPTVVPKPRPPYIPQGIKKYRRDEVDDVEGSRLRRNEIEQLMKRFPKNKVKVNRDCAEFFQCVVSFSPTDPDWPFDVKVFQLQVDIPCDYPFEMMTVTLPEDQDLPETVRRYVEVSIEEWLSDREAQLRDSGQVELVFRPFLRWLDRNVEDVVTEALKQLKRELVAKAAGLQFISAKELQKQYPGPSSSHDDDDDDEVEGSEDDNNDDEETESEEDEDTSSSDDEDRDDDDDDEDKAGEEDEESKAKRDKKAQQADKVKAMMVDPDRKGTEISLKNLQLRESTATLYFEKLCLMIHCERCKHPAEFMASPGRLNMVQCAQCSQTQSAIYRPAMAHHFSPIVGYLDLDACLPFDVVLQNSSPVFACINCSKDTKTGVVIAGKPQDHWCRVCHQKLRVATDGVRFTQLQSSKPPQSLKGVVKVVVPSRKRLPKDPAIQEGKPLPGFGTCKHYKKSYRWLRFPCCGKAYPCDVCHDSKEDHEMTFANRMICGFCCKEQPFAMDRPCKGCDMNLTRVRTVHWEGGQGCRDKITMGRNDKQKYKNSNKTVSKHSQKVKDLQSKKKTKLRHT